VGAGTSHRGRGSRAAGWYAAVACTFSLAAVTRAYQRAKKWIDRATGGVLIGLATRLAAEH
jgi:threonine/homoserine/homoserine lactone efflux protein